MQYIEVRNYIYILYIYIFHGNIWELDETRMNYIDGSRLI